MHRRALLSSLAAGGVLLAAPLLRAQAVAPAATLRFAAAWDTDTASQVGVVAVDANGRLAARIAAALEVPTRAHAIVRAGEGTFLVAARRPGDWLVRIRTTAQGDGLRDERWQWIEPDRAFNGHVIASPDGTRVFTTETNLETGMGLVGVRDARSLEKIDEWPTQGRDPHEILWVERDARPHLVVANGGIATLAETGRVKHDLPAMDPSLVTLDAATGAVAGQWRLPDPRLGTRHLARHGGIVAIALQAEHDDPRTRANAAVLALFDGSALTAIPVPRALAGYGGSVAATPDGFAVSCPRANGVAHFDARGAWRGFTELAQACPLAVVGDDLFIGGGATVLRRHAQAEATARIARTVTLDNHWASLRDA